MDEDAAEIAEDAGSLVQHPAARAAVARSRLEAHFHLRPPILLRYR